MMKKDIFKDDDFKTSTLCGNALMNCVAVACKDGVYGIRDTKDRTKHTLIFNQEEWRAFSEGIKNNEFGA